MADFLSSITDDASIEPSSVRLAGLSGDGVSTNNLRTTGTWRVWDKSNSATLGSHVHDYRPAEPYTEIGLAVPVERLYPQFYDRNVAAGEAVVLVQSAIQDARHLLQDFASADLDGIGSGLATIASLMSKTHKLTSFNEDFGAVVSFIRRATLVASQADVTRESLNALLNALIRLSANPAIDLGEAADTIDHLSAAGWADRDEALTEIINFLFDESDEGADELQAELSLGTGIEQ